MSAIDAVISVSFWCSNFCLFFMSCLGYWCHFCHILTMEILPYIDNAIFVWYWCCNFCQLLMSLLLLIDYINFDCYWCCNCCMLLMSFLSVIRGVLLTFSLCHIYVIDFILANYWCCNFCRLLMVSYLLELRHCCYCWCSYVDKCVRNWPHYCRNCLKIKWKYCLGNFEQKSGKTPFGHVCQMFYNTVFSLSSVCIIHCTHEGNK